MEDFVHGQLAAGHRGVPLLPALCAVALDSTVERIAFHGITAGLTNQTLDVVDTKNFGSRCASVVVDQFVSHCAIDVVCSVGQRRLGGANPEHDPVGFDVLEVVEHQSGDRHNA